MYQFSNLPKQGEQTDIEVVVLPGRPFRVQTTTGLTICEISRATPEATGSDIVDAIRFARDAGYRQAQADMRRQLGLETR